VNPAQKMKIFLSFHKDGYEKKSLYYGMKDITLGIHIDIHEDTNHLSVPNSNQYGHNAVKEKKYTFQKVTNYKKPSSHTIGGYLSCNGNGKSLTFELRPPLEIVSVVVENQEDSRIRGKSSPSSSSEKTCFI